MLIIVDFWCELAQTKFDCGDWCWLMLIYVKLVEISIVFCFTDWFMVDRSNKLLYWFKSKNPVGWGLSEWVYNPNGNDDILEYIQQIHSRKHVSAKHGHWISGIFHSIATNRCFLNMKRYTADDSTKVSRFFLGADGQTCLMDGMENSWLPGGYGQEAIAMGITCWEGILMYFVTLLWKKNVCFFSSRPTWRCNCPHTWIPVRISLPVVAFLGVPKKFDSSKMVFHGFPAFRFFESRFPTCFKKMLLEVGFLKRCSRLDLCLTQGW